MDIPLPEWVVPGILPEGLTILAARPKMGKSWLALNLAISISHGLPVFGTITAPPGDVLYLALEDTKGRLKARYTQIVDSPDARASGGPGRFTFGVEALRINEGLIDQIEQWIATVENPRLVIVDTLTKVRPQRKTEGDAYAESYVDMAALKTVADKQGIGMMVVHHTRKATADDTLEEVMGSTGFTGAADSILVMKRRRGDNAATLVVTGRDIEDVAISLTFDPDRGMWLQEGGASKYAADSTQALCLEYLSLADGPVALAEIAEAIGQTANSARMALKRLLQDGRVERVERGKYKLVTADVYDDEDGEE